MKIRYTKEERERITEALKALCVAKAEFWDALRAVEVARQGVEVETNSEELEDVLAAEFSVPPRMSDVDDATVWSAFLDAVNVHTYKPEVRA